MNSEYRGYFFSDKNINKLCIVPLVPDFTSIAKVRCQRDVLYNHTHCFIFEEVQFTKNQGNKCFFFAKSQGNDNEGGNFNKNA